MIVAGENGKHKFLTGTENLRSLNPINNLAEMGLATIGALATLVGYGLASGRSGAGFTSSFAKLLAVLIGFFLMLGLLALVGAKGTIGVAIVYWLLLLAGYCFFPRVFGVKIDGFSLGWFVFVFCLLVYSWAMRTR
jgi:hypothetical protein